MSGVDTTVRAVWTDALHRLRSVIDLLDRSSAPGHIAAHLDLAAHQLQEAINSVPALVNQIDRNAEPQ